MPGGLDLFVEEEWLLRYGDPDGPRIPADAGVPPAAPFPQAPLDVNVAIWVDASWIDITPFVFGGDRTNVPIRRGRPPEAGQSIADPSRASMQLNNRDGQFSPRNPTSWLYGKIGRNTLVRIAIGADVRFVGEISEWPPRWDVTGSDVWVPVEASGILRRLTQGASPLKSTLYRGLTTLDNPPKAYWPGEDGVGATEIASGIGGPPMTVKVLGTPATSTFDGFDCSAPLVPVTGVEWKGTVPTYTGTGKILVWFLIQVPADGGSATAGQGICHIHTTGTAVRWDLIYEGGGGDVRLRAVDAAGTVVHDSGVKNRDIDGKLLRIGIELEQFGSDVSWVITYLEVGATLGFGDTGTLAGYTVSACTRVVFNPGGDIGDMVIGHIAVHDEILSVFAERHALNAYVGETAGRRIERLCSEEGITLRSVGDLDATAAMGPQLPGELVELLRDAGNADGGILFEPRDVPGLAYRTRESLYRQDATLALNYSAAHLSGIEPVDDDQATRNDITVSRPGGSSARAVRETGTLSIQPPPAGVGRYDESVELNLEADSQLADAAGWLVHLGTVDEARYPVLSANLARSVFAGDAVLTAAARALDIGDRLTVANPPAWLPPDTISQLAQGFAETLGNFEHRIEINCAPESPWAQAARYDDGVSRYSSDGSTLAAAVTSSATSLSVATTGTRLWAHDDGDFDIRVGGEVMTVTAISGASSPQTFTVVRSVNGVVKPHAAGAAVALDTPRVYVR